MKKLTAILHECPLADKLFSLREKQIKTALTAARNDIEQQSSEAELEYERLCKRLGDKDVVNYKSIINNMLKQRNIMNRAAETLAEIDAVEADLNSDVETE